MDYCTPHQGAWSWPCSREDKETLPELPNIQRLFQICNGNGETPVFSPCYKADDLTTVTVATSYPTGTTAEPPVGTTAEPPPGTTAEPPPGQNLGWLSLIAVIFLVGLVILVLYRQKRFKIRLVVAFRKSRKPPNREITINNPAFENELRVDVDQSGILVNAEATRSPPTSPTSQSEESGFLTKSTGIEKEAKIFSDAKDKLQSDEEETAKIILRDVP